MWKFTLPNPFARSFKSVDKQIEEADKAKVEAALKDAYSLIIAKAQMAAITGNRKRDGSTPSTTDHRNP